MSIIENTARIRAEIAAAAAAAGRRPEDIFLVAAAKTNPAAAVREAVTAGVDAVGENRVQEMTEKLNQGAYSGVPLHFIGHLQKNKIKQVVGKADLIQSVDSEALLTMLDLRARSMSIVQDVLLEVNIGGELSKSGIPPSDVEKLAEKSVLLPNIKIRGLMAIPPISYKPGGNRQYFATMYKLFVDIMEKKYDNINMEYLSMGMSQDFVDAILEGSNMVRIGSALFGERK